MHMSILGSLIQFSRDVAPICVPQSDYPLHRLYSHHCEIAGWGMTEYNNTSRFDRRNVLLYTYVASD